MIEVRLFGDLRRYAGSPAPMSGVAVQMPAAEGTTVGQVLAWVGIDLEEVGNVFLNGCLVPRSVYPITLGYPLTSPMPLSPEGTLNTPVRPGDRVGIFDRKMCLVVV